MKKQLVSSYTTTHRFLSMFLVLLFLSISILQLVHVHQASDPEKENIATDAVSAVEKCEICDFIIHKQSTHILSFTVGDLIVLSPVKVSYNCHSCICNYEFTLQGFTNKGPPAHYS